MAERSHTIFQISCTPCHPGTENPIADEVKLSIVDLAGSERIAKSLEEDNKFKEAILINSSF